MLEKRHNNELIKYENVTDYADGAGSPFGFGFGRGYCSGYGFGDDKGSGECF